MVLQASLPEAYVAQIARGIRVNDNVTINGYGSSRMEAAYRVRASTDVGESSLGLASSNR